MHFITFRNEQSFCRDNWSRNVNHIWSLIFVAGKINVCKTLQQGGTPTSCSNLVWKINGITVSTQAFMNILSEEANAFNLSAALFKFYICQSYATEHQQWKSPETNGSSVGRSLLSEHRRDFSGNLENQQAYSFINEIFKKKS